MAGVAVVDGVDGADGADGADGVDGVDGVDGAELVGSIDPFEPGVELDGGLELWGALELVLFEMTTAAIGIGVPLSVNTSVNLEPTGGYKGSTFELIESSVL